MVNILKSNSLFYCRSKSITVMLLLTLTLWGCDNNNVAVPRIEFRNAPTEGCYYDPPTSSWYYVRNGLREGGLCPFTVECSVDGTSWVICFGKAPYQRLRRGN